MGVNALLGQSDVPGQLVQSIVRRFDVDEAVERLESEYVGLCWRDGVDPDVVPEVDFEPGRAGEYLHAGGPRGLQWHQP